MNPNRLLTVTLTFLLSALSTTARATDWNPAASLGSARALNTATLLPSGKVLVAGGLGGFGVLPDAELYNPGTNSWSDGGFLVKARREHTATLLPGGKVLVAGGSDGSAALASAELYNPATNSWSAASPLAAARYECTATLLPSGKVLVVGGSTANSNVLASAELYNPATNSWSAAGPLTTARRQHTATLLPDGRVLVAGGTVANTSLFLASAEIYDPVANSWSAAGSLAEGRYTHTATLLLSGKVLAVGGGFSIDVINQTIALFASAELYDPATNSWTPAASLAAPRANHTAALLPGGRVLVAGGQTTFGGSPTVSGELYDPATNSWSTADSLGVARALSVATLLPGGKVLVAGGLSGNSLLASAELYSGPATLFKKGQPVPGVAGKTFTGFGVPATNESGAIAFLGKWSGGAGIFVNGVLAAQVGQVLSGTAAIKSCKDPVLDDLGRVAFPCALIGAGISSTNDSVIVSNAPGGALAIIAQEGMQAAGAPAGALWKTLSSTAAPGGGGGVLILGTMAGGTVTTANDTGLWCADSAGALHLILQEGTTVLDGATVKNFAVLKAVSGTPGQTHAFNKVDLMAKVTFTTGEQAVVRLDLP